MSKKPIIVFEGIEGSGKSHHVSKVAKYLESKRIGYIKIREPGGSLLGQKIRNLILDTNQNNKPTSLSELLLYSADRAEHVSKLISPALQKNNWVISDRFSDSTLAYQGYGRDISLEIIKKIESIVCQGETPDLTIFLEITPEESIMRRKNEIPDRIESEGIEFLKKVNEGFKLIAKEKNWKIISASQDIQSVSKQIQETLLEKFRI